jgi:hypothetical protein
MSSDPAKRLFIGGEWVGAEGGRTFEDRDPFNDAVVAHVAAASRAYAQRIDAGIVDVNDQPVGTSRRCRSAASRTRGSAASGAAPSWTRSPSSAG